MHSSVYPHYDCCYCLCYCYIVLHFIVVLLCYFCDVVIIVMVMVMILIMRTVVTTVTYWMSNHLGAPCTLLDPKSLSQWKPPVGDRGMELQQELYAHDVECCLDQPPPTIACNLTKAHMVFQLSSRPEILIPVHNQISTRWSTAMAAASEVFSLLGGAMYVYIYI